MFGFRLRSALLQKFILEIIPLWLDNRLTFSPKVDAPSAIDYLLGALASDLTVGFKAQASRRNIEIDQLEVSLKAGLENVLFHLELEDEGSPRITTD